MIPDIGERPVMEDEWLARYILRREHVRVDGTLKPDPFMPYKWVELSVTRHLGLEEPEIWQAGRRWQTRPETSCKDELMQWRRCMRSTACACYPSRCQTT